MICWPSPNNHHKPLFLIFFTGFPSEARWQKTHVQRLLMRLNFHEIRCFSNSSRISRHPAADDIIFISWNKNVLVYEKIFFWNPLRYIGAHTKITGITLYIQWFLSPLHTSHTYTICCKERERVCVHRIRSVQAIHHNVKLASSRRNNAASISFRVGVPPRRSSTERMKKIYSSTPPHLQQYCLANSRFKVKRGK